MQIAINDILFLKRLHKHGIKSAIIAGGAVRDPYHKKPVNDVDVYFLDLSHMEAPPIPMFTNDGQTIDPFSMLFWWKVCGLKTSVYGDATDRVDAVGPTGKHRYDNPYITNIWQVRKNKRIYQLIALKIQPTEFVNDHFDVGLSKAYFDGKKTRYTPDFLKDSRNKTITITTNVKAHSDYWIMYTLSHYIPKIKQKYPDFKIEFADHNCEMLTEYCKKMKIYF